MISDLLNSIWFEIFAALLAITYLVLAMQQDIRCWIAWIISSVMYFFVMLTAGLVMEAALQIFYLIMGLYGWSQWKRKASSQSSNIKTWTLRQHFSALSLLFVAVVCFGYLLTANTNAVSPYIDSFTTWGAILATYMVAKKVHFFCNHIGSQDGSPCCKRVDIWRYSICICCQQVTKANNSHKKQT